MQASASLRSFWRELGGDHNGFSAFCFNTSSFSALNSLQCVASSLLDQGIVEFEDFIPWYLACFAAGEGSPLASWRQHRTRQSQVNFYKKIRPIPLTEFYE